MTPPFTYVIQIGNSDDKLSQSAWSQFQSALTNLITKFGVRVHFFGSSNPTAPWQNCCMVFEHPENRDELGFKKELESDLAFLAGCFDQDSIALTYGFTGFIKGKS